MPRRLRILPALAAAGLLAAGCEFIDNLVEDKNPEAAPLHLVVRDDWTGDSLPRATCKSEGGGLSASADLDGRIAFAAVPTGAYSFVCGANSYFDRKATVQVKAGAGASAEVRLARKPGAEWYPGQLGRRVSIKVDWNRAEDFIVPGRFMVSAHPRDDRKTFEYRYLVSPGENLNQVPSDRSESPPVDDADWWVETQSLPQEFRQDTVTVTVSARLGDTTYAIGSETLVVSLERNKPPFLNVVFNQDSIKLCNESIRVGLFVHDEDGPCKVRLSNKNQYSPHGRIDTIVPCKDAVHRFPLANQPTVAGQAFPRINSLHITAFDERGAEVKDSITFHTFPNHPPEVVAFKPQTAPAAAVAGASLSFRASLRDIDNAVDNTWVDWGDGKKELAYPFTGIGVNELDLPLTHTYSSPGTYTATLETENPCGPKASESITVVVSPPP
jgi:hypothetical protein